jgi:hypothetical protein
VKRELIAHIQRERRHLYLSFYHLLQRAKNIYLLNTESEGLDAGEKVGLSPVSRKQAKHTLTHEIYNAVLPETAYTPMVIEKSESVMLRLKEIADVGFSPG